MTFTLILFTIAGPAIMEGYKTKAECLDAGKYTGLRYECVAEKKGAET